MPHASSVLFPPGATSKTSGGVTRHFHPAVEEALSRQVLGATELLRPPRLSRKQPRPPGSLEPYIGGFWIGLTSLGVRSGWLVAQQRP
jgi:hypothetical protein